MSEKSKIPTVKKLHEKLLSISKDLYNFWTIELSKKLDNFEFIGKIESNDGMICRLPNNYIREALKFIEDDLDLLGYEDYEFQLDLIEQDDTTTNLLILKYYIEIPQISFDEDEQVEEDDDDDIVPDELDSVLI